MNNIGKIIAQRRKELGLSQLYISDVLGYSVQVVSKWENDKSFPNLLSWGALAKVLQIDLDAILNCKLKSTYNNACYNNTFSPEKFANNLRKQRKIRDMTQKDLAEQLSISYQTLLAWEKGNSFPSVEQFKKLSLVLNLTYEELYFGENNLVTYQVQKKPIKVRKKIKNINVKMIFAGVAFFAYVIVALLSTNWLNRKVDNNSSSTIYDSVNDVNNDSVNDSTNDVDNDSVVEIADWVINGIVNKPFINGVLERPFYEEDSSTEEKAKALVVWPVTNQYIKSEGCDYRFGIEIAIYASFCGRVIKVESDFSCLGNCVWVEHETGIIAFYASLEDIDVKINDEVQNGERIGTSGTSAYTKSVGLHILHFELSKDGKKINPEKAYGKKINDL